MWLKWFPWRYIVRRLARKHGFIDPVDILARLGRFSQPSEVEAPVELLRAGMVFHARGLINTKAIQHNLDWIWPYWVERQFNPKDTSFVPRAFSVTHINLTQRNWTAVGLPNCNALPLVDPRGLVTPFFDGWSVDAWVIDRDGRRWLLPSKQREARQTLRLNDDRIVVRTETSREGMSLISDVGVVLGEGGQPFCVVDYRARSAQAGWLVLSLRPVNPEGVSFVHHVTLGDDRAHWTVNERTAVFFDTAADYHATSTYSEGDVRLRLPHGAQSLSGADPVGMVTAAAAMKLQAGTTHSVRMTVDLTQDKESLGNAREALSITSWPEALAGACRLTVPDERVQFLYDCHLRTLILHSPADVYAGPFTYKRFWFRDAAFILQAMLCAGLTSRAKRVLDRFPRQQTVGGYFRSQEGEWDANGEALWIMERFCALARQAPDPDWHRAILKGARWISRKRGHDDEDSHHAGLLPAGFSAEHLGTNDYYYWDDFWGIGGLLAAATMVETRGESKRADSFRKDARSLMQAVQRSLERSSGRRDCPGMPASPYRRMDAGAIGSIVAGYPLQLLDAHDANLLGTVDFLMEHCFCRGGFFQDMIHSGVNAYLTMHIAQVLLRAGDSRFAEVFKAVIDLASPTGQWPEAIHPGTGGGCMGDGQHAWAAAEWIMMVRNMFVREEEDRLVLATGLPREWLRAAEPVRFGPAPTSHGPLTVSIVAAGERIRVSWEADWHDAQPPIDVCLPGCACRTIEEADCRSVTVPLSGQKA